MNSRLTILLSAAVLASVPAAAQSADEAPRFFLGLNGGYHASSLSFDDTRVDVEFGEPASWTADYQIDAGPAFDIGGGVRVWRSLVVTAAATRFSQSRRAAISAEVPHPFTFNAPRALSGDSQPLKHVEQAVHLAAGWIVPAGARMHLAFSGGPSFFSIERDLLSDIRYSQSYPYDEAAYEGATLTSVSQRRTGFNVGGDAAFFVTETVGFGAGVRFSRAEARLTSPATGQSVPVDAGGTQATVGLRLRWAR